MRPAVFLPLLLILVACGHSATVSQDYDEDMNALGEMEEQYRSEISLEGDDAAARLDRAKEMVRDRRYADAIVQLEALYRDRGNDETLRAEALLRLGEAEGALLNPAKDMDGAIAHLERFLEEFPDSALLPKAERSLTNLRALREQM